MFIIEDGDEFEARTERFEVLAQRRYSHIFGMFQFRDRALSDVESSSQRCLAHGLAVTEFVEADLFECFGTRPRDAFQGRRHSTIRDP